MILPNTRGTQRDFLSWPCNESLRILQVLLTCTVKKKDHNKTVKLMTKDTHLLFNYSRTETTLFAGETQNERLKIVIFFPSFPLSFIFFVLYPLWVSHFFIFLFLDSFIPDKKWMWSISFSVCSKSCLLWWSALSLLLSSHLDIFLVHIFLLDIFQESRPDSITILLLERGFKT